MAARRDWGNRGTALRLFRGLAESYDRTVDFATFFQDRYWKKWVTRLTALGEGDLVLDLGCGTLLLEERSAARKCSFIGLDLTEEMVRAGQAKSLSNVSLLVNGDAETLPFLDATFDTVVSCYVAKYVFLTRFADEIGRVTKPGGTVVLYDFAKPRGPLAPFLELYIQGGLRAAGFLLAQARKDAAFAFSNLPRIVDGTTWDAGIVRSMEERGFETIATQRLTGGVVFAYCGRTRTTSVRGGLKAERGEDEPRKP